MLRRTLLLAFASTMLFAADKPVFSGKWSIDLAKSDFGMMPPPSKFERDIEHQDPSLKLKTVQASQRGEVSTESAFTTDGKEATIKVRNRDAKVVAKWNGDKLSITTKSEFNGMEISQAETWVLASDGKTLTIDNAISTPQGDFTAKLVFAKND